MINIDKLRDMLKDHQKYHSNLQMDSFITARSGLTDYGMYKQALRELHSRYETLKYEFIEIKETELEIRKLEKRSWFNGEVKRLKGIRKKMELDTKRKSIEDKIREFIRFYKQAEYIKTKIGDLDEEKRDRFEKDMWTALLKRKIALERICSPTKKVSDNTLEILLVLPNDMRKELLEVSKNNISTKELVDALEHSEYDLPNEPVEKVEIDKIRNLLEC